MNRIRKTHQFFWILLLFVGSGFSNVNAQSAQLQLNLLLESDQSLEWTREYDVLIARHIPAKIILGKLDNENTLIGFFNMDGLDNQLILHGIEGKGQYTLHEWLDNSMKTGALQLEHNQDSLWGYWYNPSKSMRLRIHTKRDNHPNSDEIRQYQHDELLFFTRYSYGEEVLLDSSVLDEQSWENIHRPHTQCYEISLRHRKAEFCLSGHLGLYSYSKVDLVRILHGQVPQIPHDETFNSQISRWLNNWANQVFQDSIYHIAEQRWSRNQSIWFMPDFVNKYIVSGMLSIQYSGNEMIHSKSVIYDRDKKRFYYPEDFFRSHTDWNENFQETARQYIFEKHYTMIEVFPEVMDRLQFHMTLNPQGIVISSDFTPYFGRLKVQLDRQIYKDDLQRFAPFRKLLQE